MQITVDIPEDLVEFLTKKAEEKTIPVIFYAQMAVVDFFRDRKVDEEFELEERNRSQVDETLTFEERKDIDERKLRREQREQREEKVLELTIEALQSFSISMNNFARVMELTVQQINLDQSGN